ncbi:hypothetical protein MLD38_007019 [Melastoma candidum]|uniref:Uncharacterized protein n=1 Tax=Melastoma candidum TaxID=119954 RepID=A0ACB9RPA2_9MYRT|nr:hypothetical protein MLD38_007019 [Melastoma candidum]
MGNVPSAAHGYQAHPCGLTYFHTACQRRVSVSQVHPRIQGANEQAFWSCFERSDWPSVQREPTSFKMLVVASPRRSVIPLQNRKSLQVSTGINLTNLPRQSAIGIANRGHQSRASPPKIREGVSHWDIPVHARREEAV